MIMNNINDSGIKPIGMNVLLKMPKREEKTAGGIIIPENKLDTLNILSNVGIVLDMGYDSFININGEQTPEEKRPKVGDYVYINTHAGRDIKIDNQLYRMVSSDEIRAIVDENTITKFNKL